MAQQDIHPRFMRSDAATFGEYVIGSPCGQAVVTNAVNNALEQSLMILTYKLKLSDVRNVLTCYIADYDA